MYKLTSFKTWLKKNKINLNHETWNVAGFVFLNIFIQEGYTDLSKFPPEKLVEEEAKKLFYRVGSPIYKNMDAVLANGEKRSYYRVGDPPVYYADVAGFLKYEIRNAVNKRLIMALKKQMLI
jgi:hypothetical protein